MINNVVEITHMFVKNIVKKGNIVVDATCGNGYDTLFLSELVGKAGKVYAFDIQSVAIENTRGYLNKHSMNQNVELIHDSHENMVQYVKDSITCCMFNLGYLPKGSKDTTTNGITTVEAIRSILTLLVQDGIITLCVYVGHPGGFEEYRLIKKYITELDTDIYNVVEINHLIRNHDSPKTIIIEKK